jgi:hypothetical protein
VMLDTNDVSVYKHRGRIARRSGGGGNAGEIGGGEESPPRRNGTAGFRKTSSRGLMASCAAADLAGEPVMVCGHHRYCRNAPGLERG